MQSEKGRRFYITVFKGKGRKRKVAKRRKFEVGKITGGSG